MQGYWASLHCQKVSGIPDSSTTQCKKLKDSEQNQTSKNCRRKNKTVPYWIGSANLAPLENLVETRGRVNQENCNIQSELDMKKSSKIHTRYRFEKGPVICQPCSIGKKLPEKFLIRNYVFCHIQKNWDFFFSPGNNKTKVLEYQLRYESNP